MSFLHWTAAEWAVEIGLFFVSALLGLAMESDFPPLEKVRELLGEHVGKWAAVAFFIVTTVVFHVNADQPVGVVRKAYAKAQDTANIENPELNYAFHPFDQKQP